MEEIWKDIKHYEGIYQVSNKGNIMFLGKKAPIRNQYGATGFRTVPSKQLKPSGNRYLKVALYKNGVKTYYSVHRLVAEAFLPNPEGKPQVNHIDENKLNNNVENLEWCTSRYNCNYGNRNSKIPNRTTFKKGHTPWNKKLN